MATSIGSLIINLALESGAFKSGLQASEKELRSARKRIEASGKAMADFGQSMSLAVTLPLTAIGTAAVKAAMESRDAIAQVQASLNSMGDAAGFTIKQLEGLAQSEMRNSLYDDDEILRKVTANLLTFGNIAGDQFKAAQSAAVDLAAKLGMDLQSATILVGKALNDPVKGLAALSRAGIQFTSQQKEQIKAMVAAGDAAGAQKLMLAELQRRFEGSAEAARAANPGAAAQQAMAQAMEDLGNAILPLIGPIADAIRTVAEAFSSLSPEVQKTIVIIAGLSAVLGPALTVIGTLVQFGAPTLALVSAMLKFKDVAGVFTNLIPMIISATKALAAMALTPVGLTIMGIAAAATAVYLAWKNWDKITEIVKNLYVGVKAWVVDKLGAVWDWVIDKLKAVGQAFFKLYDAVVGHSYVPDMVDGIADHMARLDAVMVQPALKATDAAGQAFRDLAAEVQPILDRLFPEARALASFRADMGSINKAEKGGVIDGAMAEEARRRLRGLDPGYQIELGAAPDGFEQAARAMEMARAELGLLYVAANDNAKNIEATNVRLAKSFKDMADETLSAIQGLAGSIQSGGFLDILGSVIGLVTQLGSIGAFGGKIADRINAPRRAMGGSISAGKLYTVGERGPELFASSSAGRIVPNHALKGGATTVQVIPSPYFDVRVNQNINAAAPAIASAGGMVGQRRTAYRNSRRLA